MRPCNRFIQMLVLLSAIGLTCGCSNTIEIFNQPATPDTDTGSPGAQDDPVDEPGPVDIAGSWSTYASEIADTCGFDPPEAYAPILIEETGSYVSITVGDGSGGCQESTRTRSGDTVTLTRTEVLDLDGASVRVDLSIVYDFTPDSFTGTVTQSFTDLSGTFTDLPCAVTLAVSGTRCADCWTGCSSGASTLSDPSDPPAPLTTPRIEDRLRELARSL